MPDHKQMCKYCKTRHLPPTGKKCQKKKVEKTEGNNELLQDAAVAGSIPASQTDQGDGQRLQLEILQELQKVTQRLDQVEERMSTTAVTSTPDKPELSSDTFLESIKPSKRSKYVSSSSSSDERMFLLNLSSRATGKLKYKSLRGGDVDVQVRHKVH